MTKLANAFLLEENSCNNETSPPKVWGAIGRRIERSNEMRSLASKQPFEPCRNSNGFDESSYRVIEKIGDGAGGTTVQKCQDLKTGKFFALKVVLREGYQPASTEMMLQEQWDGAGAVLPYGLFSRGGMTCTTMELAEGGDLLELILRSGTLAEAQAARIIKKLATTLSDLHSSMGVVHRDIKPENVIIMDPKDVTSVKLCDFEHARPLFPLSHVYLKEESAESYIGSLDYMAPERFYGVAAGAAGDCWGLGMLCYCLLCGQLPFEPFPGIHALERQSPHLRQGAFDGLSPGAVSLVSGLLCLDPSNRTDIQGILTHEWIHHHHEEATIQQQVRETHAQACRLVEMTKQSLGATHIEECQVCA